MSVRLQVLTMWFVGFFRSILGLMDWGVSIRRNPMESGSALCSHLSVWVGGPFVLVFAHVKVIIYIALGPLGQLPVPDDVWKY